MCARNQAQSPGGRFKTWSDGHRLLWKGIQWILVLVPLGLLTRNLVENWHAVAQYGWRFEPIRGGVATALLVLVFGLLPLVTQRVLSGLRYSLKYRQAYSGYFLAQLAKYLPGGVYLGRAVAFRQYGVGLVSSSVVFMIEMWMLSVSGILASTPYLLTAGAKSLPQSWRIGIVLFPLSLVALHPSILNQLLRWVLARTGHKDATVNVALRDVAIILALDILFWLGAGVGFCLLVSSVYVGLAIDWVALVSVYSLSSVAALTFCVTPGCLGVREGALALMLSPLLPAPMPAVIALVARLWLTVAELVSLGLSAIVGIGPEKAPPPLTNTMD